MNQSHLHVVPDKQRQILNRRDAEPPRRKLPRIARMDTNKRRNQNAISYSCSFVLFVAASSHFFSAAPRFKFFGVWTCADAIGAVTKFLKLLRTSSQAGAYPNFLKILRSVS
jgi:hypothetical protein